jgi:hypothetical protein
MGIQTVSQSLTNETPNSSPFGFRNRIQNGEIAINQRGTANTTNTAANLNGNFQIDRWTPQHYNIGGSLNPNISIKQTADHPVKGSNGYCLEIQCNSTGATANNVDFFNMTHNIEAQNITDIFSGVNSQALTLSFWVKSNKTGTYCVELRDIGSPSGSFSIFEYTVIQSGVWEKKIINIPKPPSYSSMPNTNGSGLGISFQLASGVTPTYNIGIASSINAWSNAYITNGASTVNQTNLFTNAGNYHRLTDVQLEIGTTATPFERKSYGAELQLCQRYFQYPGYMFQCGYAYGSSTDGFTVNFPFTVAMRASPTSTVVGGSDGQSLAQLVVSQVNTNKCTFEVRATGGGDNVVWYTWYQYFSSEI